MALIPCPECGNEISSDVFKCPKCGKELRKPKRSFFGKIIKWLFIIFNVLMIVWMIHGLKVSSDAASTALNEAQRAGAAIGSGLGMMMILGLWVCGDIIIGLLVLLTRPKS